MLMELSSNITHRRVKKQFVVIVRELYYFSRHNKPITIKKKICDHRVQVSHDDLVIDCAVQYGHGNISADIDFIQRDVL